MEWRTQRDDGTGGRAGAATGNREAADCWPPQRGRPGALLPGVVIGGLHDGGR